MGRTMSALQAGLAACQLYAVPLRDDSMDPCAQQGPVHCSTQLHLTSFKGDAAAEAVRLHRRGHKGQAACMAQP